MTALFKNSVPDEEWLRENREYAVSKGPNQWGVPWMGKVTGSFNRSLSLPVDVLSKVRGQRDEQSRVRENDLEGLKEVMSRTGRLPEVNGREYVPYLEVAYDGSVWIKEGNHRIMAANELNWPSIPVDIRYFDGGERYAQSGFTPDQLISLDRLYVLEPATNVQIIQDSQKETGMDLETRQKIEHDVVQYLIREAASAGFVLEAAYDGGETFKKPTEQQAMDAVFSVDESKLYFRKEGFEKKQWAQIVLGNDGWDCIADSSYTDGDPDGFEKLMNRVIEFANDHAGELIDGVTPLEEKGKSTCELLNIDSLQAVKNIQTLLEEANSIWSNLPRDEQNRLNEVHNEEASLGHCLRWGVTATEELTTKLDAEDAHKKEQSGSCELG